MDRARRVNLNLKQGVKMTLSKEMREEMKQLYAKYKKSVNKVCDYLRDRSHIDGVRRYSKNPTQYKGWKFKQIIALSMEESVNNYFGCIYDKDDIRGDSIFHDFYEAYQKQSAHYWAENPMKKFKMIRYFRDCYREPIGDFRADENNRFFFNNLLRIHASNNMFKRREQRAATKPSYFLGMSDETFISHREQLKRYFEWPALGKKQMKRSERKRKNKLKLKTYQSERALAKELRPVAINDRWLITFSESAYNNNHVGSSITICDYAPKIRLEHHYYKVGAFSMDNPYSITNGFADIGFNIKTWQGKMNLKDIPKAPIVENEWDDRYGQPYVLDMSDGGGVDFGGHGRDTIHAYIMRGEFVITTRAVFAIGKGSVDRGMKILWHFMRQMEFEAMKYDGKEGF